MSTASRKQNGKRKKPFTSKQNRGVTGKKQKPGRPTSPKKMKTAEMFYFRGYAFRTKKELKDRIRALLLHFNTLDLLITTDSNPSVFSLFSELVSRHPNYENWGNKQLTAFKITRAETKKKPPILWAQFKGGTKFRNVAWLRCVHKALPTLTDQLHMALAFAVKDQCPSPPPSIERPACARCAADKTYIDHVRGSYQGLLFHQICQEFLDATAIAQPTRFYWESKLFSFRALSADSTFISSWKTFHKEKVCYVLLCETCRINDWSAAFAHPITPGKNLE